MYNLLVCESGATVHLFLRPLYRSSGASILTSADYSQEWGNSGLADGGLILLVYCHSIGASARHVDRVMVVDFALSTVDTGHLNSLLDLAYCEVQCSTTAW